MLDKILKLFYSLILYASKSDDPLTKKSKHMTKCFTDFHFYFSKKQ